MTGVSSGRNRTIAWRLNLSIYHRSLWTHSGRCVHTGRRNDIAYLYPGFPNNSQKIIQLLRNKLTFFLLLFFFFSFVHIQLYNAVNYISSVSYSTAQVVRSLKALLLFQIVRRINKQWKSLLCKLKKKKKKSKHWICRISLALLTLLNQILLWIKKN